MENISDNTRNIFINGFYKRSNTYKLPHMKLRVSFSLLGYQTSEPHECLLEFRTISIIIQLILETCVKHDHAKQPQTT